MDTAERATRLLEAFATSDLITVAALCHPDVVVFGTDEGERWTGLAPLLDALDAMRDLGLQAAWIDPPDTGERWAAGVATYSGLQLAPVPVRVTLAFDADGQLAHGHFSVEAPAPAG
jgi:SnoaL-like domain